MNNKSNESSNAFFMKSILKWTFWIAIGLVALTELSKLLDSLTM